MKKDPKPSRERLLQTLVQYRAGQILTPLESFVCKQAASGILLVTMVVLAMIIANTPWGYIIEKMSSLEFGFLLSKKSFQISLGDWISHGLLAFFFFLVGLEIKREMLVGSLKQRKEATLVFIAAAGGMIIPGLIYWAFNYSEVGEHGWAIPMATDTAFAIGVLALLALRVSIVASVFLTAVAIIDDVFTIAIITFFYTDDFDTASALKALIPLSILFACNIFGFRRGWIYAVLGLILWFYIHESGLHATLAGLLMALAVPAKPRIGHQRFIDKLKSQIFDYEEGRQPVDKTILSSHSQHQLTFNMGETIRSASTPLQSWHSLIATPIAILVLPIFALFNAGIYLTTDSLYQALNSSVSLGIVAGLVIGKPLGIVLFSILAIKAKIADMPHGMSLYELTGIGIVAGIGFTMSLFIALLGFENNPALIEQAKIGILIASVISALAGTIWFMRHKPRAIDL